MPRRFNDAIDLAANELQNVVVQNLGSDPGTGVADGRLYYSTALNALRLRAGGAWATIAAGAQYTDEQAQDAVATALTAGTHTGGLGVTYDDTGNTISLTLTNNEAFQDVVGAFVGDNTGNVGITVSYDDANNRINHSVAYAAPSVTLGTANAAGSANTAMRTDATILAFDATNPTTIAFGAAAAPGSAAVAARRDHTHAAPVNPVAYATPALTLGTANAGGSATTLIRSDATIAVFDATNPTAVAFGGAAGTGSVAFAARRDHTHAGPTHGAAQHQEMLATADLTDWPRTAALDLNGQKITGLADGTAATDAATFGQLSAAVAGFDWKEPVRAMTDANVATLAGGAPSVIDGVTLAANDRVLVGPSQTTAAQRGVYIVQTVGTGANGTWVRAGDMDSAAEVNRATVLVTEGTTGRGDIYQQTATVTTLGTDPQTWTKVSEGNQTYTADGTTITLSGTTFSITNGGVGATQLATAVAGAGLAGGGGTALSVNAGTGLEISGDDVRIAAAAAGNGLTGGAGSALAVGAGTGITVNADDVQVNRTTNGQKVALMFTANLAGGATTEDVTHNFGTNDVYVSVYNTTGVLADEVFSIERPNNNTVRIRSATTIPASTYRVVVLG